MARPSQLIKQALAGHEVEDEAVKSWLRFFIYKKACAILDLPREERLNAIEGEPLSEAVRIEVLRVFEYRKTMHESKRNIYTGRG